MEQHLHLSPEGNMCLSPDVGQFKITRPYVNFDLKISCDERVWNFDVTLLSNIEEPLMVERYAWIRLGKPPIDDIGRKFVEEIGRDQIIDRMTNFLLARQGLMSQSPPLELGLTEHLNRVLNLDDSSLYMVPQTICEVLFYNTYNLLKEKNRDDLEFGKHCYLQENDSSLWLAKDDKVKMLTELIKSLD